MAKVLGPTNPQVRKEIRFLYKSYKKIGAPIWKAVAEKLNVRKRSRVKVNLFKLEKLTKPNEYIVVPGKVLGFGYITHPITIAALSFSKSAKEKLEKAGCKCLTFREMIELNPKGTNVRIIT